MSANPSRHFVDTNVLVYAHDVSAGPSAWTVHVPGVEDVLGAVDIHQRMGISFWDAMIVRSANRLGCEVVWLEDLNPGQWYLGVRVVNPFAGGAT